ncbi:MAG: response regulator transcription factor [Bacteroidetes bacterium]|nr:response regulator transcription factor [Bacteroidota bacterium]
MLKNLRYMIVDDEPLAIDVIENYLHRLDAKNITRCENAVDAFQALRNETYDLIFLDIEMPLLSGIEFLKSIKNPPHIIITTAYRDYAVEGFELEVSDYLVKPISFPRFMKAMEKIGKATTTTAKPEETPPTSSDYLFLKVDRKFIKVQIADILYIESLKDYIRVKTPTQALISYQSLTEITEKLPADKFIRVHRSYTIALDKVTTIDGSCVEIDGKLIPISREHRPDVMKKIYK